MKNLLFLLICLLSSCSEPVRKNQSAGAIDVKEKKFTAYSTVQNEYSNFDSNKAINKIATIENEYYQNFEEGTSRYYGTVWREQAAPAQYQEYLNSLNPQIAKPDSLHCTLYAYEGLKSGLTTDQLSTLKQLHKERWKSREIAGWSIGYLLVKHFDWSAYLIINKNSEEYKQCATAFKKDQSYPVWRQPDIPLKQMYILGEQDSLINAILAKNEFGWGFSEQGIHTWITRYNKLKECNWLGAPSMKYQASSQEKPLFITTNFDQYFDYHSHVVIFPKKKTDLEK